MATAQVARQPKCSRCRHHGLTVPLKGHSKCCPHIKCICWKCNLITGRTRIATLERNLRRKVKSKDQHPRADAEKPVPARASMMPGPNGGATPLVASVPTSAAPSEGFPLDLRYKPPDRREGESSTPLNTSYFDESNQNPPLPVIGVPFPMPGHYPSNFFTFPFNMMWYPAVDLCNNRMVFPHFQPGAMHYLPGCPPEYREASQEGKEK